MGHDPGEHGSAGSTAKPCSTEWMPSAPITTSAVAVVPSANPTVARLSSWLKQVHRCPVRTVPGGSCPASSASRSARWMPTFRPAWANW